MEKRNCYYYQYRGCHDNTQSTQNNNNPTRNQNQEARSARQNNIQQRPQCEPRKNESFSFGYFLVGLIGVAVGFVVNTLLSSSDKEEKKNNDNFDYDKNNYEESQPQRNYNEPNYPVDSKLEECKDIICPITLEIMSDPMISKKCGHSFEGHAIITWLKSRNYCPQCHAPLQRTDLVKNFGLKNAIEYMRKELNDKKE